MPGVKKRDQKQPFSKGGDKSSKENTRPKNGHNGISNGSNHHSKPTTNNSLISCALQSQLYGAKKVNHGPIVQDLHTPHVELIRGRIISRLRPVYGYQFEPTGPNRVTSIAWHPKQGNLLLVGAKHGTIYCNSKTNEILGDHASQFLQIEYQNDENQGIIDKGTGPGGAITAIRCDPNDPEYFFTSSISGHVSKRSIWAKTSESLLVSDNPYNWWYTALDLALERSLVVAGDSRGKLYFCDPNEGNASKIFHGLHKTKIHSVVVHPRARDIIVTAGCDPEVKIWDIRSLSQDKPKPVAVLEHDCGVTYASFNNTDVTRLLTTDLENEIRVYDTGCWKAETIIKHPHRKFQHLTHMKASWHPMADIIVIGRYPLSKEEERTIDFFDAKSGDMIHKLKWDMLVSLNEFNSQGDCMASGCGSNILLWKPGLNDEALIEKRRKEAEERRRKRQGGDETDDDSDDDDDDDSNGLSGPGYMTVLPKRSKAKKSGTRNSSASTAIKKACRKRR